MKVGLLTINDNNNYGNRLQNYAMQKAISKLGVTTETILNTTKISSYAKMPSYKKKLINLLKSPRDKAINKIKMKLNEKINSKSYANIILQRENNFNKFNQFINHSEFIISEKLVPEKINEDYDYFLTGSDQVWNPNNHRTSGIDFLTFTSTNKKIAVTPSFGINNLNSLEICSYYQEWINDFKCLSVREYEGQKIIKKLTSREVPVLVDPCMMLGKNEWLEVAKNAKNKPNKKFILTYFLGGIPKIYKKEIEKLLSNYNFEIVNLGDIKQKEHYIHGPSEFIDLVSSCELFLTDSFHGVVFSIIFKKPFVVYKRKGVTEMYSRIDTLLKKFNFYDREYEKIETEEQYFLLNNSKLDKLLSDEQSKFNHYLKNSLKLI